MSLIPDDAEIVLASQMLSASLDVVAETFFPAIIGLSADAVLWTDESALSDFSPVANFQLLLDRIEEVYGVSVSDISPPFLVPILERLRFAPARDLGAPPWADQWD